MWYCDAHKLLTVDTVWQFVRHMPVWSTIVAGSDLFIQTLNPTATLSTPLANQCRRCVDDQQSSRADPTTHCDRESVYSIDNACTLLVNNDYHVSTACPAQCNQGQGRCFLGQAVDVCCNFYLQNNCTDECPSGLVNDSNSVCGEFYVCSSSWFMSIIIQFLRARANIHTVPFNESQKCM